MYNPQDRREWRQQPHQQQPHHDPPPTHYQRRPRDDAERDAHFPNKKPFTLTCWRCKNAQGLPSHSSVNCPVDVKSLPLEKQNYMLLNGLLPFNNMPPQPQFPLQIPSQPLQAPLQQPVMNDLILKFTAIVEKKEKEDKEKEDKARLREEELREKAKIDSITKQIEDRVANNWNKKLAALDLAISQHTSPSQPSASSPPASSTQAVDDLASQILKEIQRDFKFSTLTGRWPSGTLSALKVHTNTFIFFTVIMYYRAFPTFSHIFTINLIAILFHIHH